MPDDSHIQSRQRTGFFITRVGTKGSPERKRADEVFKHIVVQVAGDAEFAIEMTRSDLDPTPGPVTSQLVRKLVNATVVVADLTGQNPNVNYELGVVHSFRRPVVILVDNKDTLSFDTQNERVIEIGDSGEVTVTQADAAKDALREALRVLRK